MFMLLIFCSLFVNFLIWSEFIIVGLQLYDGDRGNKDKHTRRFYNCVSSSDPSSSQPTIPELQPQEQ